MASVYYKPERTKNYANSYFVISMGYFWVVNITLIIFFLVAIINSELPPTGYLFFQIIFLMSSLFYLGATSNFNDTTKSEVKWRAILSGLLLILGSVFSIIRPIFGENLIYIYFIDTIFEETITYFFFILQFIVTSASFLIMELDLKEHRKSKSWLSALFISTIISFGVIIVFLISYILLFINIESDLITKILWGSIVAYQIISAYIFYQIGHDVFFILERKEEEKIASAEYQKQASKSIGRGKEFYLPRTQVIQKTKTLEFKSLKEIVWGAILIIAVSSMRLVIQAIFTYYYTFFYYLFVSSQFLLYIVAIILISDGMRQLIKKEVNHKRKLFAGTIFIITFLASELALEVIGLFNIEINGGISYLVFVWFVNYFIAAILLIISLSCINYAMFKNDTEKIWKTPFLIGVIILGAFLVISIILMVLLIEDLIMNTSLIYRMTYIVFNLVIIGTFIELAVKFNNSYIENTKVNQVSDEFETEEKVVIEVIEGEIK